MSPRERLLTTLRGGKPDRVPLSLYGFHYQSPDQIDEPGKREIVARIHDETHYEVGSNSFVNRYLVTPPQRLATTSETGADGIVTNTTVVDTPKGKLTAVTQRDPRFWTSWTVKYPVETLADIEKIRSVAWELPPELAPPDLSDLPADFAQRGVVRGSCSSPCVCVAGMMPFDFFLELCATDLGLIKELTAQCLERIMSVLEVYLSEESIEYFWIGGSEWITPPMGSPKLYEELVQVYDAPIIGRVHEAGGLVHTHCHGNVKDVLQMVVERRSDLFEPIEPPPDGDITMAEAKAQVDGRMVLGGNVEARILENEAADTVEIATRAAFEGGNRGMILGNTAGPLTVQSPQITANYHRLIDVWEELSPIDQN